MLLSRRSLLFLFLFILTLLTACNGGSPGGDTTPPATTGAEESPGTSTPPDTSGETPPPTTQVYVRPNVGKLDPNGPEMAAISNGVKVMKSRPASDPTSWLYQANMHGTYDTPALQAWNTCQHGTFFFLSWHRMYLYYFERILRAASGDPKLALPFWDYTDPAQRAIPVSFRTPVGPGNPLYVEERAPGINDGATLPASATSFSQAMTFTNFSSATGTLSFGGRLVPAPIHFGGAFGQLESQPHNVIHVLVGGDEGWMSDPNMAARDPIFYFHHANIDRLWNHWNALRGGRTDPSEENWKTQTFTFFDENGQAVTMSGQQVVDTATQLNYRYAPGTGDGATTESVSPESLPAAPFTDNESTVLADKPVAARVRGRTAVALKIPVVGVEKAGKRLTLVIEGIKFGRAGVYYEVYANLPEGTPPDPKGPNYVGNLAVFGQLADGTSAHAHAGANKSLSEDATLAYDVTNLVKGLRAQPGFKGDLKLDFVPKGLVSNRAGTEAAVVPKHEVRVGRVKLVRE
jgi:hypothetical protein